MSHTLTMSRTQNSAIKSRLINISLLLGFLCVTSLMFYNLEVNPRSWHDEGAVMSVARTLVEDGVYAVRNSDGYQTFGPIQSVGPTVILPVALAFKIFGVSVISGRIIAVIYSVAALLLFFFVGKRLFGVPSAIFACLFLISYPAASFFYYGRQVLGDYPALALFLGALLAYEKAYTTGERMFLLPAGVLLGGAMVTKTQYTLISVGTLATIGLLDFFFNSRKNFYNLIFIGIVALTCYAAWMTWQYFYYGSAIFFENSNKLKQLALSTSGLNMKTTIIAIRFLFGINSGFFFLYWGIPALFYTGFELLRSHEVSSLKSILLIFAVLWVFYFTFLNIPWPEYVVAPSVVTALFVGKLFNDVTNQLVSFSREFRKDFISLVGYKGVINFITTLMAILPILAYTGYSLQKLVSSDILDQVGLEQIIFRGPRSFQELDQITTYLNENVQSNAIVETWERELSIKTNHRYHFPDESILVGSHRVNYRSEINHYSLGMDYFNSVNPDYIVIGWNSRSNQVYDMEYLAKNSHLIASFGDDFWRYDLYDLSQDRN